MEEPEGALDSSTRAKPRREQADEHQREGEGPVRRGQDRERRGGHGGKRRGRTRGSETRDAERGDWSATPARSTLRGTRSVRLLKTRARSGGVFRCRAFSRKFYGNAQDDESQINICTRSSSTRSADASQSSAPNASSEPTPPWVAASPSASPLPMFPRTSSPTPWCVSIDAVAEPDERSRLGARVSEMSHPLSRFKAIGRLNVRTTGSRADRRCDVS